MQSSDCRRKCEWEKTDGQSHNCGKAHYLWAVTKNNSKNKKIYDDFGELEFTKYGVDGPVIKSASCRMKDTTKENYKIYSSKRRQTIFSASTHIWWKPYIQRKHGNLALCRWIENVRCEMEGCTNCKLNPARILHLGTDPEPFCTFPRSSMRIPILFPTVRS